MFACTDSATLFNTFAVLCTQHRWCRVPGKTSSSAVQKPSAPSPTAISDQEAQAEYGRLWKPIAEKYQAKHHKAVECLTKDREALLAFFNFPAEHWDHLRTTNPIESVFATVRHRTVRTKGSLSSTTARLMVFKLVIAASKTWRRLKGTNHLPKIVAGVRFKDGIEVLEVPENHAA